MNCLSEKSAAATNKRVTDLPRESRVRPDFCLCSRFYCNHITVSLVKNKPTDVDEKRKNSNIGTDVSTK